MEQNEQNEGAKVSSQEIQQVQIRFQEFLTPDDLLVLIESYKKKGGQMPSTSSLKSPSTVVIMSILFGGLGVDRFMIGDTGMGILKLLTGGVCGILWIYDIFTIGKKTREKNFEKVNLRMSVL